MFIILIINEKCFGVKMKNSKVTLKNAKQTKKFVERMSQKTTDELQLNY